MVATPGTVNIELSVEVGSEPITGELRGPLLPARRFVGWVALVRTLEEAISAATRPGDGR